MEFKDRVRELRKKKGWTQEDLAKAVGASRPTVSQWETGWSVPKLRRLEDLAKALDCKVSDLFGRESIYETVYGDDIGKEFGKFLKDEKISLKTAASILGFDYEDSVEEIIENDEIEADYIIRLRDYLRHGTPFDDMFTEDADEAALAMQVQFGQEGRTQVSEEELQLLERYRSLNEAGRTELMDYSAYLAATGKYQRPAGGSDQISA